MKGFDKLCLGEKIAGVSAAVLAVSLYLNWFGIEVSGPGGSVGLSGGNAWESLDFVPIFLAATVILCLLSIVMRVTDLDYRLPASANAWLAMLGVASALLVLIQIVDPPDFGEVSGLSLDATLELGIFVALIAAIGIALGGYLAVREEDTIPADPADGTPSGN